MLWIDLNTPIISDYELGDTFNQLSNDQVVRIVRMVSARWESIIWREGMEPAPDAQVPGDRWDAMDSALRSAFAAHLRFAAERGGSFDIPVEEQQSPNILSDIPVYTRNILLSKYIVVDDNPWEARQRGFGDNSLAVIDSFGSSVSIETQALAKGDKGDPGGQKGEIGQKGEMGQKGERGATGTGSQGPQGLRGEKGDTGSLGSKGSKGDSTGTQGSKGDVGPTGMKGQKGEDGSKGPQGSTGPVASKGQKGELGGKGEKGVQGAIGSGTKGAKGDVGPSGAAGAKGETGAGTDGAKGQKGVSGIQGQKGQKGIQGAHGSTGQPGQKGQKGESVDPDSYARDYELDDVEADTDANTALIKRLLNGELLEAPVRIEGVYGDDVGIVFVPVDTAVLRSEGAPTTLRYSFFLDAFHRASIRSATGYTVHFFYKFAIQRHGNLTRARKIRWDVVDHDGNTVLAAAQEIGVPSGSVESPGEGLALEGSAVLPQTTLADAGEISVRFTISPDTVQEDNDVRFIQDAERHPTEMSLGLGPQRGSITAAEVDAKIATGKQWVRISQTRAPAAGSGRPKTWFSKHNGGQLQSNNSRLGVDGHLTEYVPLEGDDNRLFQARIIAPTTDPALGVDAFGGFVLRSPSFTLRDILDGDLVVNGIGEYSVNSYSNNGTQFSWGVIQGQDQFGAGISLAAAENAGDINDGVYKHHTCVLAVGYAKRDGNNNDPNVLATSWAPPNERRVTRSGVVQEGWHFNGVRINTHTYIEIYEWKIP